MKHIELKQSGINSLETRYIKNNSFSHVTNNQIKILPFKTNPRGDVFKEDFKSFQGIVGEIFRIIENKSYNESTNPQISYKTELKERILSNALEKVETENVEELKRMLSKLFFEEDNGLIKFNASTFSYMNFINSQNAIKEVSKFIADIFITADFYNDEFKTDITNENILHQLILECLPELPDSNTKNKTAAYHNFFPEIKKRFNDDLTFLKANNSFFLKHIEDLFKYYYFHYLSQLILRFNEFGNSGNGIKPIYFTLDWETLSETRLASHSIRWKHLEKYSQPIFAHVNAIELLNYIYVDGNPIGDYNNINIIYNGLDMNEKEVFHNTIKSVISFYTDNIILKTGSWEECEKHLNLDYNLRKFENEIVKELYSFHFKIVYQFKNTDRDSSDSKYSQWFTQFAVINYTKKRGRLGRTTVFSQEFLLFLTRLCIGSDDKIRLKSLWDKFKDRGIVFDEISKLEITKLFEKINLIEKKSDSGDAQYVKSTI